MISHPFKDLVLAHESNSEEISEDEAIINRIHRPPKIYLSAEDVK